MVSNLSIAFMALSMLISFLVPIGLVVYFRKRYKISFKAVGIGALVFFIFQMILRIPLLQIASTQSWYKSMAQNTLLIGLFLGLTAGIFEEVGRYIGMKYFLKRELSWKNGVAFGIGHGGIEAILLVGIGNINSIVYSFMINSGVFDGLIASKLPEQTAQLIKTQLTATNPWTFAAGGIERIFAITIQIALSVLVMYAVVYRKKIIVLYAVLLHALIDSPLVLFSAKKVGVWGMEGYVFLCALASLIFIIKSKNMFKEEPIDIR